MKWNHKLWLARARAHMAKLSDLDFTRQELIDAWHASQRGEKPNLMKNADIRNKMAVELLSLEIAVGNAHHGDEDRIWSHIGVYKIPDPDQPIYHTVGGTKADLYPDEFLVYQTL